MGRERRLRLAAATRGGPGAIVGAMRVLVIEDDPRIASLIRDALRRDGMLADAAHSGEEALWMAAAAPYDVLTLDLGVPGISGLDSCRRLRAAGVRAPILMLSTHDGVEDRVAGLESGADDYLGKPFDYRELLARVRARAARPRRHRSGARGR